MLNEDWVKTIQGSGGHCPCCGKWGKVYRIKMSHALVRALDWIAHNTNDKGWADVQGGAPHWMMRSKTYPLLEHWGLLVSMAPRSGFWRVTPLGIKFLREQVTVPAAVYIYDNKLWGVDSTHTTLRGCLKVNFDFNELFTSRFDHGAD